jgi:voltage-gated sodium channel
MSLPELNRSGDFRARLQERLERPALRNLILVLIIVNAIVLGLETSAAAMAQFGVLLRSLDTFILGLFVIEILVRVYAYRAEFFRDPWSVFDLSVVAIALLPATGPLAVIRALRVLRVLRALTLLPSMRRVVGGLLASVPGISSIALVMSIIFYVFAVLATNLFGGDFDQWFGSVGRSLYTLFQIMTLESWSMGIVRPVMEIFPLAWMFFVPFILIATFTMLNLFIGVIVSAIQSFHDAEIVEQAGPPSETITLAEVQQQLRLMSSQLDDMRALLKQRANGES